MIEIIGSVTRIKINGELWLEQRQILVIQLLDVFICSGTPEKIFIMGDNDLAVLRQVTI